MNPALREFAALGLGPVLDAADEMIGPARLSANHNDVVIFASVEDDGSEYGRAHIIAARRELVQATMTENFPYAVNTLKELDVPAAPHHYRVIVLYRGVFYALTQAVPDDTKGVIN